MYPEGYPEKLKFQPGHKVRCVDVSMHDGGRLQLGEVYEVAHLAPALLPGTSNPWLHLKGPAGGGWHPERFELAE